MRTICAVTVMAACVIGAATRDRIDGFVVMLAVTFLICAGLLALTYQEGERDG